MKRFIRWARLGAIGTFFTGILGVIQGCDAKEGALFALMLFGLNFCTGPVTDNGGGGGPAIPPCTAGTFLLKWGSFGSGEGQFGAPRGVAVDSGGNVYVADVDRRRIQKFDSSGNFLLTWGWGVDDGSSAFQTCTSGCQAGSSGSGDGQFATPWGVAVDSGGNVYVVELSNRRIQKFTSTGTFITKWGSSGSGDGQFAAPQGVAVDSGGNVYVADSANHRIQKFTSTGTFLLKWGSAGSGDGQFNYPERVAVDSGGNVYVADNFNHRIQKFTSTGTFITKWGSSGSGDGQFNQPEGVAVDSGGNVYVAEEFNHRIQKFTSSGSFLLTWGWGVDDGSSAFQTCTSGCQAGSSGSGDGQFAGPRGVAVDSGGNVYVGDTSNHRIQKFCGGS